ncbi:MAG TPA: hypothetical protein EYG55_09780 [Gemmatimonadetes bacterium]|jgi:hypothetical protein|nr:hypothetical protein [Gemmatimonadota bacterium]
MKKLEVGDLVRNLPFFTIGQSHTGVVVDSAADRPLRRPGGAENKEWFVSWDTGEVSAWPTRYLEVMNDPSE